MEKDRISVIVPVYNGESYIGDCIESIRKAKEELPEEVSVRILVINDGSTDGTGKILEKMSDADPSMRVFTLQDEGVSAARNKGIEEADGEFLTFVDADDRIRPDMLRRLYEVLKARENLAFVGCGFFSFSSEKEYEDRIKNDTNAGKVVEYDPEGYIENEILHENTRIWSKLFRRSFIGGLRFRKGLSIGEDMLFLTGFVQGISGTSPDEGKDAPAMVELADYRGYGYFRNVNGAINRPFTPRYMDQILCWELMEERIPSDRIRGNRIMGILLTASKIALLPKKERKEYEKYVMICREKLSEAWKKDERGKRAYALLDRGYRLKAFLFHLSPQLYLSLYHNWKS